MLVRSSLPESSQYQRESSRVVAVGGSNSVHCNEKISDYMNESLRCLSLLLTWKGTNGKWQQIPRVLLKQTIGKRKTFR